MVLYLAIAFSGVIGAIGLNSFASAAYLPPVAIIFVVAAALLTWSSGRSERQASGPTAAAAVNGYAAGSQGWKRAR